MFAFIKHLMKSEFFDPSSTYKNIAYNADMKTDMRLLLKLAMVKAFQLVCYMVNIQNKC